MVKEVDIHKISFSEYRDQVQLRFDQNEVEFKDQEYGEFFSRANSVFSIHLTQCYT